MPHRHPARALALALCLTACGTTAGDDPRAGMSPVTVGRAPWRLWVHTPPWREVERAADRVVLRVASTQDAVLMGGTAGALVSLVAESARGVTAEAWVRARYDESVQRGAQSRYAPRTARYLGAALPFTEAAVLTYDGGARWAARAMPDGSLLTLTLTAPWDLAEDGDISLLLASVDAPGAP